MQHVALVPCVTIRCYQKNVVSIIFGAPHCRLGLDHFWTYTFGRLEGPSSFKFCSQTLNYVVAICWTTTNLLEPSILKPISVPCAPSPLSGRGGCWLSLTNWPHSSGRSKKYNLPELWQKHTAANCHNLWIILIQYSSLVLIQAVLPKVQISVLLFASCHNWFLWCE